MARRILLFILTLLLLVSAVVVFAQNETAALNAALADLSERTGRDIDGNDIFYRFTIETYSDTSLGCPQEDQAYAQVLTEGFNFEIDYEGITFEYHTNTDGSIVVLCNPEQVPIQELCPGSAPPRLTVGQSGRVEVGEDNLPNNVRAEPGQSGQLLGEIPAGGVFSVLDGPTCGSGILWWRVDYNGLVGWTAEGVADNYFLEPFDGEAPPPPDPATPTPQPTAIAVAPPAAPSDGCPGLQPSLLTVGGQGRVTPGLPNNVRAQPGQSGQFLGEIPPGEVFNVLEGPNCTAEFAWWRVDYEGLVGWTAEGSGDTYFLVPVPNPINVAANRTEITRENASSMVQLTALRGNLASDVGWSQDSLNLVTQGTEAYNGAWVYNVEVLNEPPVSLNVVDEDIDVNAVAISPDGSIVAMAMQDGQLRFWTVSNSEERIAYSAAEEGFNDIDFSPAAFDSAPIVAAGSGVFSLQTDSGASTLQVREALSQVEPVDFGYTTPVAAVAFSTDGRLLASAATDTTIGIWDTQSGTLSLSLVGHSQYAGDIVFSPDGRLLASASQDGTVRLWDATSGTQILTLIEGESPMYAVTFSPDGSLVAFAGGDVVPDNPPPPIRVVDISQPEPRVFAELRGHTDTIRDLAFSPDGTLLASVGDDNALLLWGLP